ncbi:hypothetical protein [Terriglobus aquaticus]|uniref:CHRD domain-containing protein n=1 Tax=Terriglobus aquaticus TaxID=940139 RepID=A0ABW9KQD0_9BACT|nr:hypothetical protein [Terriglobus aquaticus]
MGLLLLVSAGTSLAQTSFQSAMLRSAAPVAGTTESSTGASPSTNVASALQQVAAQAGVIFTGSVAEVQPDSSGGARVTFQVERGIRGIAAGSAYTMRVSPWAGGLDRFYAGERALFMLTAPAASGFSAPVMGERGIVPLSGDQLVGNLDLRWIAADVQRGSANIVSSAPQVRSATVSASAAPERSAASADATTNSLALPDVHAIDRDLVLDLLRSAGAGQARS